MKYLVISDIHGASQALEQALSWKEKLGAEKILLLGDILYHGPRNDLPVPYAPKDVAARLNGLKEQIVAVQGNCDAEVDQMVLEFPIMKAFETLRLGDGRKVILTHGHRNEYQMGLSYGCVVLSGHTHIATAEQDAEGVYRCNPGSVSMPKGTLPASFGVLDEEGFVVLDLAGQELLSIKFKG